jgi:hypothetical protein
VLLWFDVADRAGKAPRLRPFLEQQVDRPTGGSVVLEVDRIRVRPLVRRGRLAASRMEHSQQPLRHSIYVRAFWWVHVELLCKAVRSRIER